MLDPWMSVEFEIESVLFVEVSAEKTSLITTLEEHFTTNTSVLQVHICTFFYSFYIMFTESEKTIY